MFCMESGFTPERGLKWLYLDLNSYFASVEQQERPALRGKPVAVVPMEIDGTCAIAAYEAKAYGIKTGTKIYEAKRLCPQLTCVLARHDVYVAYHKRILTVIEDCIPIDKVWSIDEVACRLMGAEQMPAGARALGMRLKAALRDRVGAAVTCSIGVAQNRYLAKVASDMMKPDGLTILEPAMLDDRLHALALTDLPGINVRMEVRLKARGVHSVAAFRALSPKQARAVWGSVGGERLWYSLHGYDIPDAATQKRVVGHSRVLDLAHRPTDIAQDMARRLLSKAATRLRRYGLMAGLLVLQVRVENGPRWGRDIRFSHSDDTFVFARHLQSLWGQMLKDCRPQRLKKIAVSLQHVRAPQAVTGDLFMYADAQNDEKGVHKNETGSAFACDPVDKGSTLSGAMDKLNKRYGIDTIRLGNVPVTQAGYVGTKIAFNRIPEGDEFHE